uniref:Uncharacterized protein n=1 Tax=Rhizophora mucronata TaxID=61149 RepID=A0A2P2JAI0_RHIMU
MGTLFPQYQIQTLRLLPLTIISI